MLHRLRVKVFKKTNQYFSHSKGERKRFRPFQGISHAFADIWHYDNSIIITSSCPSKRSRPLPHFKTMILMARLCYSNSLIRMLKTFNTDMIWLFDTSFFNQKHEIFLKKIPKSDTWIVLKAGISNQVQVPRNKGASYCFS